jgi:hypothetical protein
MKPVRILESAERPRKMADCEAGSEPQSVDVPTVGVFPTGNGFLPGERHPSGERLEYRSGP